MPIWNVKHHWEQLTKREVRFTVERRQLERNAIMAGIDQIRRERAAPADREGLGRWMLSIPLEDMEKLRLARPDLASLDSGIKSRAYLEFMRSDDSKPYKMRG